ncbi:MAG: carbohydrate binding family 9 domain-containing protein [Bacteroidales bacterium]|nr:carbohydrate binding family 9 domain-containing protein [Bacteroidales bacterium]
MLNQLTTALKVDGKEDNEWSLIAPVTLSYQLEPDFGSSPSKETMVKAAQYGDNLYFIFICHVASANEITATIRQRDGLNLNDDLVSILLDTYSDNHNAFLFQVNPLGTMADAKITSDGKEINYLWDTGWEAAVTIDSAFWIAEIMIPVKSIQHDPGRSTWGCNFSRSVRINQEIDWWLPVTENYRVSQGGEISNLKVSSAQRHNLELFPYGTARFEDSDITGNHNTVKGDIGMDIEYNYSSNVKMNVTVNPDFATVEGDKEQINLTPWELRFPEKRLFFQDGNEMFSTRIQTFYSRRIGDISYGGKVTGKIGRYQFNGLLARTTEEVEKGMPGAYFNAIRIKRDIFKASSIGLTYTDKITDTAVIHTFSADYTMNLGKEWKLTGQMVSSSPGDFLSHSAWFVRFARENNRYHYHIRYTSLGENFRKNVNETGFITGDNRREIDSDVSYKFWLSNAIKYISLSGKNNIYWSQNNELRSWYLTYGGRGYLQNKISLDLYYNNEFKDWYNGVRDDYYNYFFNARLGYNTDENSFAEISYQTGVNFKRDFDLYEIRTSFQFIKKLSVNYDFSLVSFDPDPWDESTMLNILGLTYYQSKDLWFRVFAQHSSSRNRIYLYSLIGWRFKPPFGAVYLIYSSDNYENLLPADHVRSEILFLKLTFPVSVIR